jgi:hypothetical protein
MGKGERKLIKERETGKEDEERGRGKSREDEQHKKDYRGTGKRNGKRVICLNCTGSIYRKN